MRLLLLSPYLPHRDIGHGGGISVYRMAIALARRHQVTVLCFQRAGEGARADDLRGHGLRVETVPYRSVADRGLARIPLLVDRAACALRSALSGRPYMVERYDRAAMRRRLLELLQELRPHALQVEYAFMAPFARLFRDTVKGRPDLWVEPRETGAPAHPPIVALNTHEAGVLPRLRRLIAARGPWARAWTSVHLARWARYEAACVGWADVALCVTEQDRVLLHGMTGSLSLVTVPLGVDVTALPQVTGSFPPPRRLLFVGSFDHPPNRDAALLLVGTIFPRVRQQWPDAVLDIAGRNPPAALHAAAAQLPSGSIRVHGFVQDLAPLFESAWLFVAPVFSGGGIKIKILEAMGRGIPVLSTPFGLEGIHARPGEEVALGITPEDVARQACGLLGSPEELRRIGQGGRRLVGADYSWDAIADLLARHLQGA